MDSVVVGRVVVDSVVVGKVFVDSVVIEKVVVDSVVVGRVVVVFFSVPVLRYLLILCLLIEFPNL